ncbi:MAG: threonine synthase [Nitriliruptoraceae bacterium]|nr:threonine synthase [Nitriliruptoraceae bacterium]
MSLDLATERRHRVAAAPDHHTRDPALPDPTEPLAVNVTGLRCRECGEAEELGLNHVCGFCFGPLEIAYDTTAIAGRVSRARIEAGPRSLWRYGDLLPTLSADPAHRVDLGTGLSPLRPAPRLAGHLGLDELWLKDDTRNPTGSFKDRVVTIALSAARALGVTTLACASTGNLANSVAAHGAAIGLPTYVFIPHDLERGKVVGSAIYGANVIAVEGAYDDVNRLASEVADTHGWGFVNVNLRAYYAEGSKSIGFEIAEQLGWQLPDHVVAPLASGSMYTKIDKAFTELAHYGLIDGEVATRMSGAQATGCSPISEAFGRGSLDVWPQRADTIARSLAIGNPADGYYALQVAERTGGAVSDVGDDEVVEGIRLLARTEGIFAETAGGVTVANLVKLVRDGVIEPGERTVAVISGNGYKTIEAVADHAGPTHTIAPSLEALHAALDR